MDRKGKPPAGRKRPTKPPVRAKRPLGAKPPVAKKKPSLAAKPSPARKGKRDPREVAAKAKHIANLLHAAYPDAHCMLDHDGPFELLVATILAAQCTDERVNMVTPGFSGASPPRRQWPPPASMSWKA